MDDLISREAAIEEIHKYFMSELDKEETHMQDGWEVYANMPHVNELLTHNKQISIKIKAIPSIERRGKWIENKSNRDVLNCSECGEAVWKVEADILLHTSSKYNYCPNCGAKMEINKNDRNLPL